MLLFAVVLLAGGVNMVISTTAARLPSIPIVRYSPVYLAIPVGAFCPIVCLVWHLASQWTGGFLVGQEVRTDASGCHHLAGRARVFMALGIPIALSMGITSVIYFLYDQGLSFSYQVVAQRMFYGVNNFTLLAVPFFIFAANLMNTGASPGVCSSLPTF